MTLVRETWSADISGLVGAWSINIWTGEVSAEAKTEMFKVWPVRGTCVVASC